MNVTVELGGYEILTVLGERLRSFSRQCVVLVR